MFFQGEKKFSLPPGFSQPSVQRSAYNGFDTADAAAGAFFFENLEALEFAGACGMGTAADFAADIAHGIDLDHFAVFAAEKTHCTAGTGAVNVHFFADDFQVAGDGFVDEFFCFCDLLRSHLFGMGEVKTQAFSGDVGAFLFNVFAENLAESRLKQVGRRMQTGSCFGVIGKTAFELLFSTGS